MENSFSLKAEEFDIMNIFVSPVLLNIHRVHIMHFDNNNQHNKHKNMGTNQFIFLSCCFRPLKSFYSSNTCSVRRQINWFLSIFTFGAVFSPLLFTIKLTSSHVSKGVCL